MANTSSQAEALRDLLVERLELYNSSLDVSEGSPLWNQVIAPVFAAMGADPFDTDIREFLKDRIRQEYPSHGAEEGDALVDLLVTPLELLLEPLKREIQIVRRGQSARDTGTMRLEDAQDLAGNFFTEWTGGARATASVRVYYASPTYVNVFATSAFTTASGLRFYPVSSQSIRPETMLLQRSGTEYYIDVQVVAEEAGKSYNVGKGTITAADGLSGWTRVSNLARAEGGLNAETTSEVLDNTRSSLTERSLNVRRGIVARLKNDFTSLVDVEAIGYGDPEMDRDILTGGGEGRVVSTGVCLIVGQFVLMFSMFEQRGELGMDQISVGDEIELNYWKFLYDVDPTSANERFVIDTILFDSRDSITEMPSVLLFRVDGAPTAVAPIAGSLPGVLPGVFCVVRSTGRIEISDIPGGIRTPNTARGTIEIADGEVHIGGHYDVWVRPGSTSEASADIESGRSEVAHLEAGDLVINGESPFYTHLVHREYSLTVAVSSGAFRAGERVTGGTSGARGTIDRIRETDSASILFLKEMDGVEFEAGEALAGTASAAAGIISSLDSYDFLEDGALTTDMVLSVVSGSDMGVYRILKIEGPFLYLNTELTTTGVSQFFRILSEVTTNIFDPKTLLIPFGEAQGENLRTVIGSKVLRTDVNLQDYGVELGDTIAILEGADKGTYVIKAWDATYGGSAPALPVQMTSTNSGLRYQVYRPSSSVQKPLVRIQPSGVSMLDPSGKESGYTVPYALPVEGEARAAFSGSKAVAAGLNGFILMDPGSSWAPTSDYVVDPTEEDWVADTGETFEEFYQAGDFTRFHTDGALDCAGHIAVFSIYDDGHTYLDSNLPAGAQSFLQNMKDWFLGVIDTFNFGGDETALVNLFSPLRFGPPSDPSSVTLLMQFEVCIPFEVFDGCNNVMVALPEFDWESEFEGASTFEDAMDDFNDGSMRGNPPALLQAQPGSVVTLLSGSNAGAYVIDKVFKYRLVFSDHIDAGEVSLDSAYQVAVAVIRDQFPVPPLYGLAAFFDEAAPSWTVPAAPNLPYTVTDDSDGSPVDGWDYWVKTSLEWFFEWMRNLGFDLPEEVELDVPATMRAFWQMLFTGYIVGKPTCAQFVRLHFLEPTSCTVYAPQVCTRYQFALPAPESGSIEGARITLPLHDLEGLAVSLTVQRLSAAVTLSGTLPASAATAATLEELAAILQELLDSGAAYVTFSGPATASGALTIEQAAGGVDEWLFVGCDGVADGFFWLGFFSAEPGRWPAQSGTKPFGALSGLVEVLAPSYSILLVFSTAMTHIRGSVVAGSFETGDAVSGSVSGATGRVWAWASDDDAVLASLMLIIPNEGSASFVVTDVISSGAETVTANIVTENYELSVATAVPSGTHSSYDDLADLLGPDISDGFVSAFCGADFEEVSFPDVTATVEYLDSEGDLTGDWRFVFTVVDESGLEGLTEFTVEDFGTPSFLADYMGGDETESEDGVATMSPSASPYTLDQLALTVTDAEGTEYEVATEYNIPEALAFDAILSAGDVEDFVQHMNSAVYAAAGGARVLLWVHDDENPDGYYVRAMYGGADCSLAWDADGMLAIGFPSSSGSVDGTEPAANSFVQGDTSPGDEETVFFGHREPTLFVAAAGAAELLFAPDLSAVAFQVFPGQDSGGDLPVSEYPRDLLVGSPYDGQVTVELSFGDLAFEAPLEFGVQESTDFVEVHEQRRMLEHTSIEADSMLARDRVPAVLFSYGSNVIRLPEVVSEEFNFLDPNSGLFADEVQVGDQVFIEEGEALGAYTIVDRGARELKLDRGIEEAPARIYRLGNDGHIVPEEETATITSDTAAFTEDDIGRYVTVWASNHEAVDGSFRITAVTDDGGGTTTATLETDPFVYEEQDMHWAVVKAPLEEPAASGSHGRTVLIGVRPIRIYSGTPSSWRVTRVIPTLSREDSRVFCSFGDAEEGPKAGIRQPYRIVRPGVQHISSTAMASQQEEGLYYFDVLTQSLGGDDVYNVPKGTRMEPVFGTFDSDGYRLETADPRLTFSSDEETHMVLSSKFLPEGFDDVPSNHLALEGKRLRVTFDYAPVVSQVQRMMSSETDRVLNSNVLVRHFLPSYVYFTMDYEGGNSPARVGAALEAYINGLPAVEELDISKLEKVLHANVVVRYDHPVRAITLTHDMDRRIVGHRSHSRLSDDDIAYSGTNRTTFFIAGSNYSSEEEETDIPDGERIYLRRVTSTPTLR